MFENSQAYSGISARDMTLTRSFYEEVLGLAVRDADMGDMFVVDIPGGGALLVYPKGDQHVPATFTVLNFPVEDVDETVDELSARGVNLLRYEGMNQDEKGVSRGKRSGLGPDIAWFADPSGNILSVHSV